MELATIEQLTSDMIATASFTTTTLVDVVDCIVLQPDLQGD